MAEIDDEARGAEGLEPYWTAHSGEDYSVVMRPSETTDNASIRLAGRDRSLAVHIANQLNLARRTPSAPGGVTREESGV